MNGETFRTQVDIIKQGGDNYLPLRFLAATTDTDINWDSKTKSVILTKGSKHISYPINSLMMKDDFSYIGVKIFQQDFPEFNWNPTSEIPTIDVAI